VAVAGTGRLAFVVDFFPPTTHSVISFVAPATLCDIHTKQILLITKLTGRHAVEGTTSNIALVSLANQPWNWRIKVSREH